MQEAKSHKVNLQRSQTDQATTPLPILFVHTITRSSRKDMVVAPDLVRLRSTVQIRGSGKRSEDEPDLSASPTTRTCAEHQSSKNGIVKRDLQRACLDIRLKHRGLYLWLFLFIALVCSLASLELREASSAANMTHQERWKKSLNEKLAKKEAEDARKRKPSQKRPKKELVLKKAKSDTLKELIQNELDKMPTLPFVSWGVHHMYYGTFPPEIDLLNIKGDRSYKGKPPAADKLEDNQILIAHRVPNPKRLIYSIPHWEKRIKQDKVRNIGIYLMGDELNYGSSFLNDEMDGSSSPFSFLIRDYYFDRLKNAEHTPVIQLGSMTCREKRYTCSVKPLDTVFVNMLPSAVKMDLQPKSIKPASKRSKRCYWAGSDRNDRKQMVDYFNKTGGCEVYMTPGFNQGNNKTVYADILADSAFGLVPSGNSPETHRLAETLMFGGIPAMLDQDARAAYLQSYEEPIPMVTGRTWEEVHSRMRALNNDDLDKLQEQVVRWWKQHWSCVHDDMRWILAQAHAVSEGRDLCSSFPLDVETAWKSNTFELFNRFGTFLNS